MVEKGSKFPHPSDGGEVRVMAVDSGYAMCRRPGKLPFVMGVREIEKLILSTPPRDGV